MEPGISEPEQLTMKPEQRLRYGDVQLAGRLQEPIER
jgi:hypothetical protein